MGPSGVSSHIQASSPRGRLESARSSAAARGMRLWPEASQSSLASAARARMARGPPPRAGKPARAWRASALDNGRGAGAAALREQGNRLQALRTGLRRLRWRRLFQERLDDDEDHQRDEEEVYDAPGQIAVLDGVVSAQ